MKYNRQWPSTFKEKKNYYRNQLFCQELFNTAKIINVIKLDRKNCYIYYLFLDRISE